MGDCHEYKLQCQHEQRQCNEAKRSLEMLLENVTMQLENLKEKHKVTLSHVHTLKQTISHLKSENETLLIQEEGQVKKPIPIVYKSSVEQYPNDNETALLEECMRRAAEVVEIKNREIQDLTEMFEKDKRIMMEDLASKNQYIKILMEENQKLQSQQITYQDQGEEGILAIEKIKDLEKSLDSKESYIKDQNKIKDEQEMRLNHRDEVIHKLTKQVYACEKKLSTYISRPTTTTTIKGGRHSSFKKRKTTRKYRGRK